MSVNIFHSNKSQNFNDCYFAEPTIKQKLVSSANNSFNGCVLVYGAYGTGKSIAVGLIARDRGVAKSEIHYVHTIGSQLVNCIKAIYRLMQCSGVLLIIKHLY